MMTNAAEKLLEEDIDQMIFDGNAHRAEADYLLWMADEMQQLLDAPVIARWDDDGAPPKE